MSNTYVIFLIVTPYKIIVKEFLLISYDVWQNKGNKFTFIMKLGAK
jgi:hypothetical protein